MNNFSFGGANAHAVLKRAPPIQTLASTSVNNSTSKDGTSERMLFVLSANDEKSAKARVADLILYLEQRPDAFEKLLLHHLAFTLGQHRSVLPWKIALTATNSADIIMQLLTGTLHPTRVVKQLKIGFVFTGQGAQWYAMGRELLAYPEFRSAMETADTTLKDFGARFSILGMFIQKLTHSSIIITRPVR